MNFNEIINVLVDYVIKEKKIDGEGFIEPSLIEGVTKDGNTVKFRKVNSEWVAVK